MEDAVTPLIGIELVHPMTKTEELVSSFNNHFTELFAFHMTIPNHFANEYLSFPGGFAPVSHS